MGFSETYIKILKHPTVDATIEFIKKFKSSKSYWSVSYLILLFTLREAIAWKFASAIKTFCETQVLDSSFPTLWNVLGFFLDVGGSWELVALGTFVFVVLSLVKVAESEGTSVSVRENYLTLFLLVFVGSVSLYQSDEIKSIVEDTNRVLKELKQDKNVTNYLIEDAKKKDLKYAKLEAKYEGLRKSIRDKAPNEKEIIDNANDILEERGIESAIFYLRFQLSYLKDIEENVMVPSEDNSVKVETKEEIIKQEKEMQEDDNETIIVSTQLESKWIKPLTGICEDNNGEVNGNDCQATWDNAKVICSASGGRLPSIEILGKVVTDCGGGRGDYKDYAFSTSYKACYKEKGFIGKSWSGTTESLSRIIESSAGTTESSSYAMAISFFFRTDFSYEKKNTYYVMCLRGQ